MSAVGDIDPAVPDVFVGIGHLALHVPALSDVTTRDMVAQAAVKLVRLSDAAGDVTVEEALDAVDVWRSAPSHLSSHEVMRDVLSDFLKERAARHG